MKINVACRCGSVFQAPEHLVGQTVRCPGCKAPLTVSDQPQAQPTINDLTELDQPSPDSSAQGSTAGRTVIRLQSNSGSTIRPAPSDTPPADDNAITQELDDRMTRMYEVYTGQQMAAGRSRGSTAKRLIGLGIVVITLGIGAAIGYNLLTSTQTTPNRTSNNPAGNTASNPPEVAKELPVQPTAATHRQTPDAFNVWHPADPSEQSGAKLATTDIKADTEDASRFVFDLQVKPASRAEDRRLSMATSVVLFRALDAQGPFTQIDRSTVQGFDRATGSLEFKLFDAKITSLDTNLLHYRLSGFDSDGNRLFDSPPAAFPYAATPAVNQGRATWSPRAADQPRSAIRLSARIDAPGWEDTLLWQVLSDGPINQPLPDTPDGLPVVIESANHQPTAIQLDANSHGRWQRQWIAHAVHRNAPDPSALVGVTPHAAAGRLDYRTTPDDSHFKTISASWVNQPNVGPSRVISFTPADGQPATATFTTPPALTDVAATAYNGRVHLSWDNVSLLANLKRYTGELQIAVRRIDRHGNEALIALLPIEQINYTDTTAPNHEVVAYEVSLIQAGTFGAEPRVYAQAWAQGHGPLPVLASFPATYTTASVTPENQLDRLYVSLGINELCYPRTGPTSVKLQGLLAQLLHQTRGVAVVDRAAQRTFVGAGAAVPQTSPRNHIWGTPAQLNLRLVDSTGPNGDKIALWLTDTAAGSSTQLAVAPADQVIEQADLFTTAMKNALDPRIPGGIAEISDTSRAPRLVVVGPIIPVHQPAAYYHTAELTDRLAGAGDRVSDALAVVSREFWLQDTQRDPGEIDPASHLQDAVLIVGRAWTTDTAHPGVNLHAIDATTGQLIDRFNADKVTPQAVKDFSDWCASLKLQPARDTSNESPLLLAEASLKPIHPVWRDAVATAPGDDTPGPTLATGHLPDTDAVVLSFGLPSPEVFVGQQPIERHPADDPLHILRPYTATPHPLTFDVWTQAYADYLQADCNAFIAGFERIQQLQKADPGPFVPHLIVRGEHRYVGDATIPAFAGGLRVTPTALNLRTFFPMGVAGQPMLDYHTALSEAFKQNPWAMSRAWKQVPRPVAEPFLRSELFGINDGQYGRPAPPDKPVPFGTYLVACLLADIGHHDAYNYKQRALALATQALVELTERRDASLDATQAQWASDALLVLIYENDPGTITQMADDDFRRRCFKVDPAVQGDALRMMVDRVGDRAWDWAGEMDAVDWSRFSWRSRDEMNKITRRAASLIPEDQRLAIINAWPDPDSPASGDVIDATASSTEQADTSAN